MKCPVCYQTMTEGVVQSGREIYFTTVPHKFFFVPNLTRNDEVCLSVKNWTGPTCRAYHCEKCKKVVIDYEDE